MDKEIQVSVICCAYNQEAYIADALDGFLMQKTTFPFEVLVSDDASQDRTSEIIRSYAEQYPDIIKPVMFEENQYSQGIYPGRILNRMAKGRYFAICEGDDYWTCEDKLQRQYEAMEAHPECDMCAHTALLVRASDKAVIGLVEPMKQDGILPMEDVIIGGGNYIATNSLFYRRGLFDYPVRFAREVVFDYSSQMQGAMRGGILYLHDTMSAYRRGADNSWTLHMEKHQEEMKRHLAYMVALLDMVEEDTDHRFTESVEYAKLKYEFHIASMMRDGKAVYSRKYEKLRREMAPKKKLILFLKCYAPWVISLWQKAKGH